MRRRTQRRLSLIKAQLDREDSQGLVRLLRNVHPADLAEILNYLEREEGTKILNSLNIIHKTYGMTMILINLFLDFLYKTLNRFFSIAPILRI